MELKGSPEVREVLFHRDVVNPGFKLRIEKLQPLLSYMEDQRATEKQVLETKASRYASEIKEVPNVERERSFNKGIQSFELLIDYFCLHFNFLHLY